MLGWGRNIIVRKKLFPKRRSKSPRLKGIPQRLGRRIGAVSERMRRLASVHESETYCLRCFESMNRSERRCDSCGFGNLRSQRRMYWNLNPSLLWLQSVGRGLGVLSTVLITVWLGIGVGNYGSKSFGAGYLMIIPIATCIALWKTSGKLTMHLPYFRAAIFWVAASLILGWWMLKTSRVIGFSLLGVAGLLGWVSYRLQQWKLRKCGLKNS